jgi:hypothetical protein
MFFIDLALTVGVFVSGGKVLHCAKSFYVLAYEKYKWRIACQIIFLLIALAVFTAIHYEGWINGENTLSDSFWNRTAIIHFLLQQFVGLAFVCFDHPYDIFNEFNKYPEMVPRISIF